MPGAPHDGERGQPARGARGTLVQKATAVELLRRVGLDAAETEQVLAGVTFPAWTDDLERHAQPFGITPGTLIERLGGSP